MERWVGTVIHGWAASPIERAIVECDVDLDGALLKPPAIRAARDLDCAGVFGFGFTKDSLKVRLDQEACQRMLPSPKRRSRHLANLSQGTAIRVVLNGKADWPSGRYYYLLDFHVIFHGAAATEGIDMRRTFDLQADLL
ncbi:hypothetical protein [Paludibaculum fermentans]|uniref:hypothetical protein n=1 Tax=Paludibaculum fermentans TaxID=1473598 RepID=UPI003EB6BF63